MSININSFSSISSRKGVSGLMSGLDTDDLVKNLTAATRSRITKTMQNKQIVKWKQEAYQDITDDMDKFYTKYFKYASSSDSIFNKRFFSSSEITSSSSKYVTANGNNEAVNDVVVKDIRELATKTGFTSSHRVSQQSLDSKSKIYESWDQNTMAGQRITISYGGKNYSVGVSSDFYIDSSISDSEKIDKFINELNKNISNNPDLKGKIEFSVSGGTVSLKETGGTSGDLKVTGGSSNIMNAIGFYKADEDATGSSAVTGEYALSADSLFESNVLTSGGINISIDDKTSATLALGSDFRFSKEAMQKDSSGNFTSSAIAKQAEELQKAYEEVIKKNYSLKDKVSVTVDSNLNIEIKAIGESKTVKVTGGNQEVLDLMGLTASDSKDPGTSSVNGSIDANSIFTKNSKTLSDTLSGSTITFLFNGSEKKIEFKESEKDQFSTVSGLKNYLQNALDKQVGDGRVTVSETDGKLSFKTTDPSHTISVSVASSGDLLGDNGALHISAGYSNRINFNEKLSDIKDKLKVPLKADADGNYKLSINGKEFSFTENQSFGDMISKINSDTDVGVKINYSSVTDTFSVTATETGSTFNVDISDVGSSNLASAMFGAKDNASDGYVVEQGKDFSASISFDGGKNYVDVNRDSNAFSIDGIDFEFKGKAEGAEEENITFKKNEDADEIVDKVTKFIDEYNKIVEKIQKSIKEKRFGVEYKSKEKYLPLTDEQREHMSSDQIEKWEEKAKMGLLHSDSTLDGVLYGLRRAMSDYVEGSGSLYELGISTTDWKTGGVLVIDEDKLRAAIAQDPDKVSNIFSGENGVAERMDKVMRGAIIGNSKGPGSLVAMAGKKSSLIDTNSYLARRIEEYDDSLKTLKEKLQSEETRWYTKFSRLETLVGKLNSQSDYFSSMSSGQQ